MMLSGPNYPSENSRNLRTNQNWSLIADQTFFNIVILQSRTVFLSALNSESSFNPNEILFLPKLQTSHATGYKITYVFDVQDSQFNKKKW